MSLAVAVPWSLPGRPAEHSPAQHVQMDVVHRLAGACIHVEHSAVAFFVDIRLHSKFLGHLEHLADERAVSRLQIIQCRNVLLGHHQEMNGSLRPKILKCYDEVVLMHKVRGCFVLNDSAKKTRLLHGFNLALLGVILCTTLLAGNSNTRPLLVSRSAACVIKTGALRSMYASGRHGRHNKHSRSYGHFSGLPRTANPSVSNCAGESKSRR